MLQFKTRTILAITIINSIIATIKDIENQARSTYVSIFSLKQNFWFIINANSSDKLSSIDGIRVITMCWVISGHIVHWSDLQLYKNVFVVKQIFDKLIFHMLFNTLYSVETFFCIGYIP